MPQTCSPQFDARLRQMLTRIVAVLVMLLSFAPFSVSASELLVAHSYKMAGDASRMRLVVHFDKEPDLRWFLLRDPHRLAIEMPEAEFRFDAEELTARSMVTGVYYGNTGPGTSRLILSFDGPFSVERVEILQNESEPGYRMVADIGAASEKAFQTAMAEQVATTGATAAAKGDRLVKQAVRQTRPFRVVIDPGHGGIDTGAAGVSGTQEKTITLAFALELKKRLEEAGGLDVFLTRDRDLFLRLDERVKIARQNEADLFISIHADSIRQKSVRGATVYTVSDKASDPEAAAKAIRENLADEIAGVVVEEENEEVADILVDLIRRETQGFSIRFARSLVEELKGAIAMIPTNPHRFAGFRVLRAPDVPSVLLELGYLSNPDDEALLRDPEWRAKAANGIASAIGYFAAARQGAGG